MPPENEGPSQYEEELDPDKASPSLKRAAETAAEEGRLAAEGRQHGVVESHEQTLKDIGELAEAKLEGEPMSPEAEARRQIDIETQKFEDNVASVEQASAEFDSPKEMADLAQDLTPEQKRQVEQQIAQLQENTKAHKERAAFGLMLANPVENLKLISNYDGDVPIGLRLGAFAAYVSGAFPMIGLEEFLRNGGHYLRDKHKLGKLQKERRKKK